MKAKNYIVTAMGFVKDSGFNKEQREPVIEYTHKLREAKVYSTKAGLQFLERHGSDGWVWTPYAQDPIRDKYTVKKVHKYGFEESNDAVEEWQPVKIMMTSDSDAGFLLKGKLESDDALTFEEAKAEALKRNTEMLAELMEKIDNLKTQKA